MKPRIVNKIGGSWTLVEIALRLLLEEEPRAKYMLRYTDSETCTIPLDLTHERIDRFIDDHSLEEVIVLFPADPRFPQGKMMKLRTFI